MPKKKQQRSSQSQDASQDGAAGSSDGFDSASSDVYDILVERLNDMILNGTEPTEEDKRFMSKILSQSVCYLCHRESPDLKRCVKCKIAVYCDRQCQKAHWPKHKTSCSENIAEYTTTTEPDTSQEDVNVDYTSVPNDNDKISKVYVNFNMQHSRCSCELVGCFFCKTRKEELMRCTQCKIAKYCNRECQKGHWAAHKRACKRYTRNAYPGSDVVYETRVNESHGKENMVKSCLACEKKTMDVKKCSGCNIAEYCNEQCEENHRPAHKTACANYPSFSEMMARTNKLLADVHNIPVTEMVFPPQPPPPQNFRELCRPLVEWKAVLMEIIGPFYHMHRHGVYVKDINGKIVHIVFYHKPEEEANLLPNTLSQLLAKGNFLRWFYPRWRHFADDTVGFRIDNLDELEFIRGQRTYAFPIDLYIVTSLRLLVMTTGEVRIDTLTRSVV